MYIPSCDSRVNFFANAINLAQPIHHPPILIWLELFISNYPQAVIVFEALTPYQRREGLDQLIALRVDWSDIILKNLLSLDLDFKTFCNALSIPECDQIVLKINYWDSNSVVLLLKRTSGYLCSRICGQIWFGEYYKYFSFHLFMIFRHIEGSDAFSHLQNYITDETVHRILPAIKEDVDTFLKWILSASKSDANVKSTIKTVGLIYNSLNDNQRRRLILRSVKCYPETFLYLLTALSEEDAKLICNQDVDTMNRFLIDNEQQCRELIPQNQGNALRTLLSGARFPVRNRPFCSFERIMGALQKLPYFDAEDLSNIESIPKFIFCFFDYWNRYRNDLKLIVNELNEHQLKALSLGVNKDNAIRVLANLETSMNTQSFNKFLKCFNFETIEPYLTQIYVKFLSDLDKAAAALETNNEQEIHFLNLQFKQLKTSPNFQVTTFLCESRLPGVVQFVYQELDRYLLRFQEYLSQKQVRPAEPLRDLYSQMAEESDKKIGLLDDDDLLILGIKTIADKDLLERYRKQPRLQESWKILFQKSICTLKALEAGCLIESQEDCWNLHELAVKLL